MIHKFYLTLFITLLFSVLFSFFIDSSINLFNLINSLFYISLLLTIIGGAMLILQGGFFNGMISGFKRLFHNPSRVEQVLGEIEGTRGNVDPYILTFTLAFPFFLAGILLLVLSILLSWAISI